MTPSVDLDDVFGLLVRLVVYPFVLLLRLADVVYHLPFLERPFAWLLEMLGRAVARPVRWLWRGGVRIARLAGRSKGAKRASAPHEDAARRQRAEAKDPDP